jgi:branched-chain amino acid transport system substrate-binding protein
MLPATGTFASLRQLDHQRLQAMHVAEQGGKLGGREIEYYTVDDESDPPRPPTTSTS